jgi:hypothetical protein
MDVYIETNRLFQLLICCLPEWLAAASVFPMPGRLEIKPKGEWENGTKVLRSFNIELKICHGGWLCAKHPSAKARGLSLGSKLDAATQFAAADKGSQNAKSEGPGGSNWAGRRN